MGTGSVQLLTTKRPLDSKLGAFLSSCAPHAGQPSPGQRPPRGGRRAKRACLHSSPTWGEETGAPGPRGIPNRCSAHGAGRGQPNGRACAVGLVAQGRRRTRSPRMQRTAGAGFRLTCRELSPPATTALPLPRSRRPPFRSERLLPLEAREQEP